MKTKPYIIAFILLFIFISCSKKWKVYEVIEYLHKPTIQIKYTVAEETDLSVDSCKQVFVFNPNKFYEKWLENTTHQDYGWGYYETIYEDKKNKIIVIKFKTLKDSLI